MIALLGLLELLQIGVELLLLRERGRIDARQHRPVRIAAPIGAGDLHQLEGVADLAGRGHVRPAAKVGPLALAIELHLLIGRNGVDQLDLERFALLLEQALRLLARDDPLRKRLVAGDDLAHPLFDRREVFRRERLVAEEVVVEAVLDHRADGDLRSGPERLHGFGENVRRVVADQFERPRIVARDELERRRRGRSGPRDRQARRHGPSPRRAWRERGKWIWRFRGPRRRAHRRAQRRRER